MSSQTETDLTADDMRLAIGEFLTACDEDELALLCISGHGVRRVRDGGEFYVVARDTDFDRVAETGVSAGFFDELLEQCAAPQKVVMIDCCRSSGFAVGRTSDQQPNGAVAKSGEPALLTSRGMMTAGGPLHDLGTRIRPEVGTPPCAEQTRDDKKGAGPPPMRVAGRRGRSGFQWQRRGLPTSNRHYASSAGA
ncbi:caspase family protein [Streptomyces chilikensis]|uniref:caspase family protein n=1 Tax=Streptomyces chilikensis TaxID=1194079 RepID=UPI0023F89F53|nr:caspase family protein [Streptomyces chilikensis]